MIGLAIVLALCFIVVITSANYKNKSMAALKLAIEHTQMETQISYMSAVEYNRHYNQWSQLCDNASEAITARQNASKIDAIAALLLAVAVALLFYENVFINLRETNCQCTLDESYHISMLFKI